MPKPVGKILKLSDALKLSGKLRLTVTDPKTGKIVAVVETENLVVTVGKGLVCDLLIDASGYDTGITYCALGTGTNAPALGNTTLQTEAARKIMTSRTRAGSVMTFSTFFTAAQSTVNVKEVGLFGHSTAGAGANTGILFCRALMSYDNSGGNYDLTFSWECTVA